MEKRRGETRYFSSLLAPGGFFCRLFLWGSSSHWTGAQWFHPFIRSRPSAPITVSFCLSGLGVVMVPCCCSRKVYFYHPLFTVLSCLVMSDSLQPHGLRLPGSSMGILQARILAWVAMPSSRGSSQPRGRAQVSALQVDSLPSEPPGKPRASPLWCSAISWLV